MAVRPVAPSQAGGRTRDISPAGLLQTTENSQVCLLGVLGAEKHSLETKAGELDKAPSPVPTLQCSQTAWSWSFLL